MKVCATKKIIYEYIKRKKAIRKRLEEFRVIGEGADRDIFRELCFCILTPQAKAVACDMAVKKLCGKGLLFKGGGACVGKILKGAVRFHNKKARYLVEARKALRKGGGMNLGKIAGSKDALQAREWLVNNIKGLGYKEASHFLRNIGLGHDIAILDRHILKNLKSCGVIEKIPPSLGTRKAYFDIERKMRAFSGKIGIPLEELDLLFWSIQTGYVFK